MPDEPGLSVILLTRNGSATIGDQLEALAGQRSSRGWELLVVDNGSTDDTLEIVERYRDRVPGLRVVDASARSGTSYASNVGIAQARASAIAFCHDDDVVAEGWVEAMTEALAEHDVVGARLDVDALNPDWAVSFRGRPQSEELVRWDVPGYPPYVFGAALGTTRRMIDLVGGFDEDMLPSSEDMDYCWRAIAAGADLHFAGDAIVRYRYRGDWRSVYRQARGYGVGNVRLYKKHRALGLPSVAQPWRELARRWLILLKLVLLIRNRASLGKFVWTLGMRVGSLRESIRQRVLLP
jgi:GT2 family glycosyltransferase